MSTNYGVIRSAIANRQQVMAIYDGLRRDMCPHVIGWKNGTEKALFFQFAGDSRTGLPPGGNWRACFVERLTILEVKDGLWHTGANHSRPQHNVDQIDLEVSF